MNKYWFYKVGLVVVFLCFALLGEAKVKLPTLCFRRNGASTRGACQYLGDG